MAKIRVMIYTTLRSRLGFSKIDLPGKTVQDLLLKLAEVKKPDVSDILFNTAGHVKQHFVLTLNSEIMDNKKAKTTKVKAGDILHVFPPISGG